MTDRFERGLKAYASQFGIEETEVEAWFAERHGERFGNEAINAAGGAWNDDELSLRERSVVVVTALITLGGVEDRLRGHVRWAIQHGVSPDELEAIIALLAVYIGYARASTASDVVQDELARLGHRSSRASGSTSA
ncbi:MAG: carboxymuconolactone decarboxylase family protein [Actinomycetota bacterium]|nr:carboxymuconolactone decarboxylase family protein [Actinomycetota bacterium]